MPEIAINQTSETESSLFDHSAEENLLMSGETIDEYFDRIAQEWAGKALEEAMAEREAQLEKEELQEQQRENEKADIALIENLDPSVKVRVEKVVVKDAKTYERASSSAPSKHEKGGAATESKPQRLVDGKIIDENGVSVIQQMIEKGNVPPEGIARAQKREQELATQGYSISETFRSFNGDGKMWRTVYRLNENGELTYENYQVSLIKRAPENTARNYGEQPLSPDSENIKGDDAIESGSTDEAPKDNHVYDFVTSLFERAEITIAAGEKDEKVISESPAENLAEDHAVASVTSKENQGAVEASPTILEKSNDAEENASPLPAARIENSPTSSESPVQAERNVSAEEVIPAVVTVETAEPVVVREHTQDIARVPQSEVVPSSVDEGVVVNAPAQTVEIAPAPLASLGNRENRSGAPEESAEIVATSVETSPVSSVLSTEKNDASESEAEAVVLEKQIDSDVRVNEVVETSPMASVSSEYSADRKEVVEEQRVDSFVRSALEREVVHDHASRETSEHVASNETEHRKDGVVVASKEVVREKETASVATQLKEPESVVSLRSSIQAKEVISSPRVPERHGIRLVRVEPRSEVRREDVSRPLIKEERADPKERVTERSSPEIGSARTIPFSANEQVRPGMPSRTSSSQYPPLSSSEEMVSRETRPALSLNGITLKKVA